MSIAEPVIMQFYSICTRAKHRRLKLRISLLTEVSDKLYKFVDGVFPKVESASFDVTREGYLILCVQI